MMDDAHPGLSALFNAQHAANVASEGELEALCASLRPVIKGRLAGKSVDAEDLDEMCQETMVRVVEALRRSRQPDRDRIQNLNGYACTVADRVLTDHIRHTRPNWSRLKRRISYLLSSAAGTELSHWRLGDLMIVGLSKWQGRPIVATTRYRGLCDDSRAFCAEGLAGRDASEMPLRELLVSFFRWIETPLDLDHLTGQVAELCNVRELSPSSLETLPSSGDANAISPMDIEAFVIDSLSSEAFR